MISLKQNSYLALSLLAVASLMQAVPTNTKGEPISPSKTSFATDMLAGLVITPLTSSPSNEPTYFVNQWQSLQAKFNALQNGQCATIAIDESKGAQAITITFPDGTIYPYPLVSTGSPYQIMVTNSLGSVQSRVLSNQQSIGLYKGQLEAILVLPDESSIDYLQITSTVSNNNFNTLSSVTKSWNALQTEWKKSHKVSGTIDENTSGIRFQGPSFAGIADQLFLISSPYSLSVISGKISYTLQVSANNNKVYPFTIMTKSEALKRNITSSGTQAICSHPSMLISSKVIVGGKTLQRFSILPQGSTASSLQSTTYATSIWNQLTQAFNAAPDGTTLNLSIVNNALIIAFPKQKINLPLQATGTEYVVSMTTDAGSFFVLIEQNGQATIVKNSLAPALPAIDTLVLNTPIQTGAIYTTSDNGFQETPTPFTLQFSQTIAQQPRAYIAINDGQSPNLTLTTGNTKNTTLVGMNAVGGPYKFVVTDNRGLVYAGMLLGKKMNFSTPSITNTYTGNPYSYTAEGLQTV